MNEFRLVISSPDGNLFDSAATVLSLRGADGDLAIMAGHARFITSVVPGKVTVTLPDDSVKSAHTDGGLLTVGDDFVTLISSSLSWE